MDAKDFTLALVFNFSPCLDDSLQLTSSKINLFCIYIVANTLQSELGFTTITRHRFSSANLHRDSVVSFSSLW